MTVRHPTMATDIPADPAITLCMINRNGEQHLPRTLEAIERQDWRFAEILVVDDGSTDASLDILRQRCPQAKVIGREQSGGPAAARNIAFAAAANDLVLAIDNDVRLVEGTVRRLLDVLIEQPAALLAAPRTLYETDPEVIQYDSADCHFLGLMAPRNADRRVAETPPARARTTSVVTGATLIHRGRWSGGPLFDESFGFNLEDHDFGVRAVLLGHELWCEAGAVVLHGDGSVGLSYRPGVAASRDRLFYLTRNRWATMSKSWAPLTLVLLAPALALFELAQLALLAGRGHAGVWWQAARGFTGGLPAYRRQRRTLQATRRVGDRAMLRDGPLPLTGWVKKGPMARLAVAILQETLRLYWRLVRGFV
jgi:glycosyltransferase involved in cell wall biosynthesis